MACKSRAKVAGTAISAVRSQATRPFKAARALVGANSVPMPTAGMVAADIENFLE
ncbi:hypothetical protein ABFT80_02175 [Mesorhizobium sp. SB112]|uniref:hypothetical protein n=1 Tax=Mesorhizobium sp. SB112 TaxID=3151853 RepID=UPI00326697AA